MTTWELIKRLWRDYMRHYVWYYIGAALCLSLIAGAGVMILGQLPNIIDEILQQGNMERARLVAIIIVLTLLVRGSATFGQAVLLNAVSLKIIRALQNQMFEVLTKVDMVYLQKSGTAAQISRFTNDVNILSGATGRLVTGFGKEIVSLAGMTGLMFYYNATMAAAIAVIFPLLLLPVIYLARKIRTLSKNIQLRLSDTTAILDDSLKSAMQVRAYNLQKQERARVGQLFHKVYNLSLRSQIFQNLIYPILDILGGFIFAGILLWGTQAVINSTMSPGEFVTFFAALFASYTPLRSLSGLYAAVQNGLAAAARIFQLLDYKPDITSHSGTAAENKTAPPLKITEGTVAFTHVNFAYDSASPQILHDVNVTFKGGKRNALVGYSGSGKTSLLQLIPRFFDVNEGGITIDGQDIRRVNIESLRDNIGFVFQNAPLFNISVADNIRLGKNIDDDRLQEVCEQALLSDFIASLPQGLNTQVGELGGSVSGGQRQRIAIARALLKQAPILLLDEATSALDQAHESALNRTLQKLMKNRTVIVIAHRLSTVKNADHIYLLKDGKIVGNGTHSTLLKTSSYYRNLCDSDLDD